MLAGAYRGSFRDRLVGAVLLDENVYDFLKEDPTATGQAALVVVLAALAAAIGAVPGGATAALVAFLAALLAWAAYAFVVYWLTTRWLKAERTPTTRATLVRMLGFASSPRLLLVLGALPLVGGLFVILVFVWTLGTTVLAVRHALGLELWPAMATALVSWLVLFAVSLLPLAFV